MNCAPVLLIGWNRPSHLERVINSIEMFKPTQVYFACDGPIINDSDSKEMVMKTRAVAESCIYWTEAKVHYQAENRGCKEAVAEAITWFFQHVEQGIILEDDCEVHPDFLEFSTQLLEYYKSDSRIWCISASNFQRRKWGGGTYYFSRYNHCWGWATWRRCWIHYDKNMESLQDLESGQLLSSVTMNKAEEKYWKKVWENLKYKCKPNTWDYQWTYTCFVNSGLTVTPNVNLVNNIGYGPEATHTKTGASPATISTFERGSSNVIPLKHAQFVVANKEADLVVSKRFFSGNSSFKNRLYILIRRLWK